LVANFAFNSAVNAFGFFATHFFVFVLVESADFVGFVVESVDFTGFVVESVDFAVPFYPPYLVPFYPAFDASFVAGAFSSANNL